MPEPELRAEVESVRQDLQTASHRRGYWISHSAAVLGVLGFAAVVSALVLACAIGLFLANKVDDLTDTGNCKSRLAANMDVAIGGELIEIGLLIDAIQNSPTTVDRRIRQLSIAAQVLDEAIAERADTLETCT
jgi:hypothetical protein